MNYVIFDDKYEVAKANGRLLYEAHKEGEILKDRKLRHNSKESVFFDLGEELEGGKFACKEPKKHKEKFGGKASIGKPKFKNKKVKVKV